MALASVLLLTALVSAPALPSPCEAGASRIQGTVPADGDALASADGSIGVWWTDFALDPEFVSVQVDGAEIEGSSETQVHEGSFGARTGLTRFTPRDPLPLGARVSVSFSTPEKGGGQRFSFSVGEETSNKPAAAPAHLDLTMKDMEGDSSDPCSEDRRNFWGTVGPPSEPDPNDWLLIYRATPDGRIDEFFTVVGTADQAPLSWEASTDELDREAAAECFTVVQLTPNGELVSSPDAACATGQGQPSADLPVGCSALHAPASPALLLSLIGLLRRRRAREASCASSSFSPPSPRRCRASSEA